MWLGVFQPMRILARQGVAEWITVPAPELLARGICGGARGQEIKGVAGVIDAVDETGSAGHGESTDPVVLIQKLEVDKGAQPVALGLWVVLPRPVLVGPPRRRVQSQRPPKSVWGCVQFVAAYGCQTLSSR